MSCCGGHASRRTFLLAGGAATATIGLAACASGPDQEIFSGGTSMQALQTAELPVGASVQMAVGSTQLLLYRSAEHTVHAYSAICTHQGCIVGVQDDAHSPFKCPCHASNFDKDTGEAIAGPAVLPLTRHPAEIVGDWIMVEVAQD